MDKWNVRCIQKLCLEDRQLTCLKDGVPPSARTNPSRTSSQPLSSHLTNPQAKGSEGPSATLVVAATEQFITLLDAIKIGMDEKDVLHPLLVDVVQSVNEVTDVEFENKGKIIQWLIKLNQMRVKRKYPRTRLESFILTSNKRIMVSKPPFPDHNQQSVPWPTQNYHAPALNQYQWSLLSMTTYLGLFP